jgi:hypothetical protein
VLVEFPTYHLVIPSLLDFQNLVCDNEMGHMKVKLAFRFERPKIAHCTLIGLLKKRT